MRQKKTKHLHGRGFRFSALFSFDANVYAVTELGGHFPMSSFLSSAVFR